MSFLGPYAVYVLSAYAVSILLLAGLVWLSWRRAARVRDTLAQIETAEQGTRRDG